MMIKAKLCKICKEVQPAHFAGIRNDGKTKIWTNAAGQQWNGKICSSCQLKKARKNMRSLRAKRSDETK